VTEPRLNADQRRALAILAASGQNGVTRSLLIANGYGVVMINALVSQELATLTYEKALVGGKFIEIAKVRITKTGRVALGDVRLRQKG
jgi:hypothetical protein